MSIKNTGWIGDSAVADGSSEVPELREEMVSAMVSKLREVEDHARAIGASPNELLEAMGYAYGETAARIALMAAQSPSYSSRLREASYAAAFHRSAIEHITTTAATAYQWVIKEITAARSKSKAAGSS